LLVTIDTLRADRVGGGLSPELNELARHGTTFTTVRAAVPLTLPSHATILTGTLPPEHGVRQNGVVRDPTGPALLARTFKAAGYQTAAFVGAYVLDRRFGLSDGFDTYDDRIPRDPEGPTRLESERPADAVVDAVRSWLARADRRKPLFLWVHLYDPHAPYQPPAEYLQRAGRNAYDGEVLFADAQAGAAARAVRETSGESLVVAVTGDHGEGLGEHGESTHGMLAYDSTLRVPFVLAGPNVPQGARRDSPASLRDIAPTLLALAGLKPSSKMTGRDLLGGPATTDVYAETVYPTTAGWSPLRALVDERWKVIASSTRELYDISRDPGERQNIASANPTIVAAMGSRAERVFGAARTTPGAVSAEAAERLGSLGYVSPTPASPTANGKEPNPRDRIEEWNRFESALTLVSSGRSADALAPLRQLASSDPDARVFQSTLAQALKNVGRTREALAIYRKLVARWPEDAALFHDLAVAAREVGNREEALKAEKGALGIDPRDANAQNGLGLLYADAGQSNEAAAAFEKATGLDPNNASIWTNLGNARRALGDVAAAERSYRRALDLDARHADAANGLGVIFVQQRRAREAIPLFEQAIASDPTLVEAQLNLGIAYQESGDRAKAAAQYRRVLATAPSSAKEKRAARELLAALR
jgi:arylsulfatase A-like enzyme/tetratricopeptide (TPR) repeat protein